jgi:hypothetical protein
MRSPKAAEAAMERLKRLRPEVVNPMKVVNRLQVERARHLRLAAVNLQLVKSY